MAGYAGYGLCGGGIGIFDLASGEATLLNADDDLLPGHSPITVKALSNGDLVAGTSISAPGGGHPTAREAELFVVDWSTKKLTRQLVPVAGASSIVSIEVGATVLVYGLASDSTFFVYDPATNRVVHNESYSSMGGAVRHALHWAPDGRLLVLLSNAVMAVDPVSYRHETLARPPSRITAGGALVGGRLSYASGAHIWSYEVPPFDETYLPYVLNNQ
jgi:hypothetical protein